MQVTARRWRPDGGWTVPFGDDDGRADLVLAFGDRTAWLHPRGLLDLAAAHPDAVLAGCSTAGQILGGEVLDGGWVAAAVRFDTTTVTRASASVTGPADSAAAGEAVGRALAGPDLRVVLVFSDGLVVNGSDLVAGVRAAVGPGVVVTGGLAGDGDRFEATWVVDGTDLRPDRVVAVGLAGDDLRVGTGSEGGWHGFGPVRTVTASEGAVLRELDDEPALDLYRRYLGELAADLPSSALLVPLAVWDPDGGRRVVRTVLGVEPKDGSMTFAGGIPAGWHARLMRANAEDLIAGAGAAADAAGGAGSAARDGLAVAVSCVGRRLVLGVRADEELEAVGGRLPSGTTTVGYYSYGELAPGPDGRTELHNQTMTVTTLSEQGDR